jgi:hypothetical protein
MNQPERQQAPARSISGKLVILGILAVALLAAGTSWWYRYNSTHRAAEFWGPDAALIRDADTVIVSTFSPTITMPPTKFHNPAERDFSSRTQVKKVVTGARGLVHLRNALLMDRNFDWSPHSVDRDIPWKHSLVFFNGVTGHYAYLLFSPDFQFVTHIKTNRIISCEPIAAGLLEMFTELMAKPPLQSQSPNP